MKWNLKTRKAPAYPKNTPVRSHIRPKKLSKSILISILPKSKPKE